MSDWKLIHKSPKMQRYQKEKSKLQLEVYSEMIDGKKKWFVSKMTANKLYDKEMPSKKRAIRFANTIMK